MGEESYVYSVRLEGPNGLTKDLQVHPHPLLDPSNNILPSIIPQPIDAGMWWWDITGMAIVKAGGPWTDWTGVRDFHELPEESVWDLHCDCADCKVLDQYVQGLQDIQVKVPLIDSPECIVVRLARGDLAPGGTDGL